MEFSGSSVPGKPSCSYQVNSEIAPVMRKPLSQINNLSNQQSPVVYKRKYGYCIQNLVEESKNKDVTREHTHTSSPASSDSSKASYQSSGGIFPPLLIRDPSKSSHHSGTSENLTPSPAQKPNTLFTPVTTSSRLMETPSRHRQGQYTPNSYVAYNPFEGCAEVLQLPTVSPSLFKEVVSPSAKEDGDKDFSWAIDHLALLRPTPIDTSPLRDMDIPIDPEYERRAQDAIDRFFSSALVVPSPWTSSGSSPSLNLMSALFSSGSSVPHSNLRPSSASPALLTSLAKPPKEETTRPPLYEVHTPPHSKTYSVWCQTELTLPPILPTEVEDALAPFCTFMQDQAWQHGEDADESLALNTTTTLRRKLLFSDDSPNSPPSCEASPAPALKSTDEQGSTSPASTGPLPLDEEEAALPWGVSMIRPGSRVSLLHSPASPSFFHSSVGVGKSFGSSFSSPGSDGLHRISPITYLHPRGFRTLPSPSSDTDYTLSTTKHFPASPELSPILRIPSTPYSEFLIRRDENEWSKQPHHGPGRGCRIGTIVVEVESSEPPTRWESSALNRSESPSVTQSANDPSRSRESFTCEGKVVFGVPSKPQMTPRVKESSPRSVTSKASPQFSSSPIKCRSSSDSSRRSDFNRNDDEGVDSPPKFSESPPVSPIAWSFLTPHLLSPIREQQIKIDVSHSSFLRSQDSSSGEGNSLTSGDDMEDAVEEEDTRDSSAGGNTRVRDPFESNYAPCRLMDERKRAHCGTSVIFGQPEVIFSNSIDVDTDSPRFEESTLEETSGGQDTGYYTGSSLQTTNTTSQSNLVLASCSNLTKECKSSILHSPQEKSTKFDFSSNDTVRYSSDRRNEMNCKLSPH